MAPPSAAAFNPRRGVTASPWQGFEGSESAPAADGFDEMFSGARHASVVWAKKTRAELEADRQALARDRAAFEEEMVRLRQEFRDQCQAEYDRNRQDRQRAQMDLAATAREAHHEAGNVGRGGTEGRPRCEQDQGARQVRLLQEKQVREMEKHALEKQRMLLHNAASEAIVELNVGGTVFVAPRQVLAQQPGSFLGKLMTGQASATKDQSGRCYLDRDSGLFREVLAFLREPELPPAPRDAAASQALCQEAAQLGIHFFPFPLAYAIGGHDGQGHLASTELLDVENRCWRSCRAMRMERSSFGGAALRSRLHVFGGQNSEYKALCDAECHDCLRGEWLPLPEMSEPRRNCAAAQDGQRLFAVGGFDGSRVLRSVEALDPRMRKWQALGQLSMPRSAACATTSEGRLWVLGGTSGTRQSTVEVYDPRADRWELVQADMTEVRSAGQACVCKDRLYALGGVNENHTIHRSMECFGRSGGGSRVSSWTVLHSMEEPRMDFGCCEFSGMIMVSGGQHGDVLPSSEFYKPELDDWQPGPPMLTPRYGHQLLLVNM
mmetsp:Transcript_117888/g.263544  ORF Transcript_117888/g.263544 Transcript_117888/m.263544 type:complete len:550 (-) Transcript_117888:36-1685(-)